MSDATIDDLPTVWSDRPAGPGEEERALARRRFLNALSIDAEVSGTFGRYVPLAKLGAGGMGVVVRAYDPVLRREVAIKHVSTRSLTATSRERLLREAQAMARLHDPNVVAVHDVEILEDRVLIVMALVAGTDFRKWLADEERERAGVLRLAVQAGRGLAAAHRAGLVHRDFKPSNILITPRGRALVTDFGLATGVVSEAASDGRTDGSGASGDSGRLTESGAVLGTPAFMAPEQFRGQPSERSDQYALSVTCWEALVGARPFSGDYEAMLAAKLRGPPAWPGVPGIANAVGAVLRRGLDADPDARWPSVEVLLAQLEAAQSSRASRRRYLPLLAVVGAGGLVWALSRGDTADVCAAAEARIAESWSEVERAKVVAAIAHTQVAYADSTSQAVTATLDSYAEAWAKQHRDACEATMLRGEQSQSRMELRMSCLAANRTEFEATVGLLGGVSEAWVAKAVALVEALPTPDRCSDGAALEAEAQLPPTEVADAVDRARRELAGARANLRAGRYPEAAEDAARVVAEARAVGYPPLLAKALIVHGRALGKAAELEQGEAALREALRVALGNQRWRLARDAATRLVAHVGYLLERGDEGLAFAEVARGLDAVVGDPQSRSQLHTSVGMLLQAQGHYAQAEAEHRAALALRVEPGRRTSSLNNLAAALQMQGKYVEAEQAFRDALALRVGSRGPMHPSVASIRSNLAAVLFTLGRHEEAEPELRVGIEILERSVGPAHPNVAALRTVLSAALEGQGRLEEAEVESTLALTLRREALPAGHPQIVNALHNLAGVHLAMGEHETAEQELLEALRLAQQVPAPSEQLISGLNEGLALTYFALSRYPEAEEAHRAALRGRVALFSDAHPDTAVSKLNLALALEAQGQRTGEVLTLAQQAWDYIGTNPGDPALRARSAMLRARLALAAGDASQARRFAEIGVDAYGDAGPADDDAAAQARRFLASLR